MNNSLAAAYSEDGVTGIRRCKDNPPVVPTSGSRDADSCYKPTALYNAEKNIWRTWYNGRAVGAEYTGLAEKQDDVTRADYD